MWWRRRPHCHCPSQAFIGPALDARTASGWSPSPPPGPAFSPHCGTSSGAEMRTDEKSLGFAWPFGDSCRPQPAAQTLQHRVQAAHSPATSPACPPRDTLCFCPDKPLATPPRVPLLGVPSLSCLCALSALQNPAVFTTPPPTLPPPNKTDVHLLGHRLLHRRSSIVPSWCLIQTQGRLIFHFIPDAQLTQCSSYFRFLHQTLLQNDAGKADNSERHGIRGE